VASTQLPISHHGGGRADDGARVLFLYDLASPEAYLAAERVTTVLPVVPEWVPALGSDLGAEAYDAWRCADEEAIWRSQLEDRALAQGLQPVRWPDPFPFDAVHAMLVATYAKGIGRAVAFSLAAFRQAFAGGRALSDPDNVLIAAAACEMHPAAVQRAAALRSVRRDLDEATTHAGELGVRELPAVIAGDAVFTGARAPEDAAAALARVAAR
jgi:2-hydroxychromene-2-carboxylate isomerase